MEPIARVAARVVLLDPEDTFLLIRSHDPDRPDGPTWWHVPGGGLDPGETAEEAAAREIAEEVGVVLDGVGPCVGTRTSRFTFGGRPYVQEESFFVVRLPVRVEVSAESWSDIERRSTLGWRWWSVADLATTADTVYPAGLSGLVSGWLSGGAPTRPARIT